MKGLETDVIDVIDVQPSLDKAILVTSDVNGYVADVVINGLLSITEIDRPCFKVFDVVTKIQESTLELRPGVWLFGTKHSKSSDQPILTQQWVCSPMYVDAVTHDGHGTNFGRLLFFCNTLGNWRKWAMPMDQLSGSGDNLRAELLAMGLHIDPNAHRLLGQYLQDLIPEQRIKCALQVGWCGDCYVLPDEVFGPEASDVIFQSGERGHEEYTKLGTLDGWKTCISEKAIGNPLLTLAISASFSGPMLAKCNAEGGGIHFVGDSSTGKTTLIEAACSVWGGPNFRRSWRATANGIEGAAVLFNDGLLALDEISECEPREVGAIIYALGNGRGKQRASRTGTARAVSRWRCFVLSSGERSIGTTMAEGGHRVKAGQSVRLLDIPAVRKFGAWDNLHGMSTGAAFSDAIKRVSVTHYGQAGRAFLERLTRDKSNFCELLEKFKLLPEFCSDGGEGQDKRASSRFALQALSGELATEYGITGWPEGEATKAAAEGFKEWRSLRGHGNDERRQILEQLTNFIDRNGDSRFSDANDGADPIRNNRAGYWRDEGGKRIYLFNAAGMHEATCSHDFKRVLSILQEAGALSAESDSKGARSKPYSIGGRSVRLYRIDPDKLRVERGH